MRCICHLCEQECLQQVPKAVKCQIRCPQMFWKRIPDRWTGIRKGIRNIHHGSAVMALDFNLADLGSVLAGTQMRKGNGQPARIAPAYPVYPTLLMGMFEPS